MCDDAPKLLPKIVKDAMPATSKIGMLIGNKAVSAGCIKESISVWVPAVEPAEITICNDRPNPTLDGLVSIEVSDLQCVDSELVIENEAATLVSMPENCAPDNVTNEINGVFWFAALIDETDGLSCVKELVADPSLLECDVTANVLEPLYEEPRGTRNVMIVSEIHLLASQAVCPGRYLLHNSDMPNP